MTIYLKELVAEPEGLLARLRMSVPPPSRLRAAVAELDPRASTVTNLEGIADLQDRVSRIVANEGAAGLSRRDLREGCKAFLLPPSPPGRDEQVREALIDHVRQLGRRAAFFALIDSYIDAFEMDDAAISAAARSLAGLAAEWPWREGDHWPQDIQTLNLFDTDAAPSRVAERVMASNHPPRSVLTDLGLGTAGRVKGGLVMAAFRDACGRTSRMRGAEAAGAQIRLLKWARDDNGALAYPAAWADLADACLSPWRAGDPSDEHKALLIDGLEHFGGGDPRVRPERWRTVIDRFPDAYGLLLRWLTKASVLQFLDIVDRSLRDGDAKRMWSYRRAFWTSYLMGTGGGPAIDAAWVAFGDDGARLANELARRTGDRSFSVFGLQEDRSSQHAALIVRIGDLTIVDWSHSAKYNVWESGDRGRPALFKRHYGRGELYSAPLQESHSAPASYAWQKKLARIIERRTFWSEKPEWRPKRV